MRTLKIALDCDGVLSDFTHGALRVVAEITGRKYAATDIKEFDFTKALGLSEQESLAVMRRIGSSRGFAASLPPYPLARQGVRRLRELGHVFCVTAPWNSPWWREERSAWLALHFGIDIVHHTADKSVYEADVFVDDRSDHVRAWLSAWPGRTAVLWRTLHNISEAVPCGAQLTESWEALYQIARETALGSVKQSPPVEHSPLTVEHTAPAELSPLTVEHSTRVEHSPLEPTPTEHSSLSACTTPVEHSSLERTTPIEHSPLTAECSTPFARSPLSVKHTALAEHSPLIVKLPEGDLT